MTRLRRRILGVGAVCAAACLAATACSSSAGSGASASGQSGASASGQSGASTSGGSEGGSSTDYPTDKVQLIFPFGAGSPGDLNARQLAKGAPEFLGGDVQVIDKPGAAGTVGVTQIVKASPDGYTMGFVPTAAMIVQPLRSQLPYGDPSTYTPVAMLTSISEVMFVAGDSDIKTMKDLVQKAKDDPNSVSVATSGVGTVLDIDSKLLAQSAGVQWTDVSFDGEQQIAAKVIGHQTTAGVSGIAAMEPYFKSGKLHPIGVFSEDRLQNIPDVPTAKEQGYDVTFGVNNFVIAPPDTPKPIVEKWASTVKQVVETKAYKKFAKKMNFNITYKGPDELTKWLNDRYKFFEGVVKDLNLG